MVIFKKVIKNWECEICNGRTCQEFIDKYSVFNLFLFIHWQPIKLQNGNMSFTFRVSLQLGKLQRGIIH